MGAAVRSFLSDFFPLPGYSAVENGMEVYYNKINLFQL